jgi:hypothetical protein
MAAPRWRLRESLRALHEKDGSEAELMGEDMIRSFQ